MASYIEGTCIGYIRGNHVTMPLIIPNKIPSVAKVQGSTKPKPTVCNFFTPT